MRRVAVTGMGVISPVGNDCHTFWNNLTAGTCGIGRITHFDTAGFKVKIAAEVKDFDPLAYMNRDTARKNDLYAQYALAAAAQAMDDSALAGKIDAKRLGVYVGSGIGGMQTLLREVEKLTERGPDRVSPFLVPMMISNMAAGVIAITYNAQGPCLPIVTACATGTHSIGEAYHAIAAGRADAVIAGGAEAAINPLALAGFTNCMALTQRNDPTCASIPFDKRRDGFVMGEGAGMLVLEEYEHALARGARIYAEICGYGNTCDAYHVTAVQPEAAGAATAIRLAMDEARGWDAQSIYINAHGTSTPINDRCETQAIKSALGDKASTALVSSTKSMTGHMLGAAGAAEAIAAILALRDGVIPPTIGYQQPDDDCDLDYVPNAARYVKADLALSLSLGFGGHNACVAFQNV
ncbi:MAG: beta-ketoacyl-ACP synthase II [Eubacteriales bacterium]|nr:beta-ketoacyl-ACP synthase II [Eubacteriales bacterium]